MILLLTSMAVFLPGLTDESAEVRAEARAALKKISKGEDFGPAANATLLGQQQAQQKWRAWWAGLEKRK